MTTVITSPTKLEAPAPELRRGSSAGETSVSRLRSMRDRVRDRSRERSRDRSKPVKRDRAGSVAVASLPSNSKKMTEGERETSAQGLKSWWKSFSGNRTPSPPPPPGAGTGGMRVVGTSTATTSAVPVVFRAPLARVLTYASMQISTSRLDGSLYVWGEVPIVVGRCGAYLKGKADIEGLFRIPGSEKRMRDLQALFDGSEHHFGGDIDWDSSPYTPHDVATIFRRYMTQMPEPVIPFAFYEQFRNVQSQDLTDEMRVREYRRLIPKLPKENKFLLLYTLDLLGVVDQHSEKNLMEAANLAVIFQPAILNHHTHHQSPTQSALSKQVVEFLIAHQSQFIMSMAMKMRKTPSGNPVPTVVVGTPEAAAPSSEAPQEVAEEATNRENEDATVEDATPPLEQPTTPKSAIIESAQLASPVAPTSVDAPSTPQSAMFEGISQPLSLLPPQESNPLIGSDSIEPSDSDDEPPAGGYYVVDKRPATAPPQTSTPQPTVEEFTVQDLIAPAPARPPRSSKHGRASLPPGATPVDLIAPSDSDDDAPSGGYVVYENKRPASNPNRGSPDLLARALQAAEGRTNSPKSLDLNRRRTLPTKRVSDFTARMRRAVLDA